MMIAAALAMPEIPLPVFCLMVGAAIGLGAFLHHTPPDPVRFTTVVVICQRRITGDWGDFGLIFLVLLVITGLLWMPVVLL